MSLFSNALRLAIQESGLSQVAVSEKSGSSQAQLSRYLSGEPPQRPPRDVFENLVDVFPQSRVHLVAAYLEDELPPKFRDQFEIAVRRGGSSRVREEAERSPSFRSRMPHDLRAAHDRIGRAALENEFVANTIKSLAGFVPEA
ncbi:MAG: hypothetical protein V7609_2134 [Verrucomicrobiota bacterium]